MSGVDVDREASLVQPSLPAITASSLINGLWTTLFHLWTRIAVQPATTFVLLSLVFGVVTVFVVPPLRGPDEIAHFLRIYSYTRGELLPTTEVEGRKGILVNRELYNQLRFFKDAGEWFARDREEGVRYGAIMALYRQAGSTNNLEVDQPTIFMPFAGTEGYNPVAYIPYIVAGVIARPLGLDFPDMLLLMRLFGLITFIAVAAYAIAVTPVLNWAFVLISLLPVAIYNRSVLSADGAALCSALVITALCLSAMWKSAAPVWHRSLWMTLCALSKQPQIIFVLLELIVYPLKELPRRWNRVAIVVLPCLILSPLWVAAVSADIAAWRLQLEEHHPPEHFDPLWKLFYMWEHPAHFPLAVWRTLSGWGDRLWQELIGILGWQDILLHPWAYLVLTMLLMLVPLQEWQLESATRARVIVISGLTVLGYVGLVYLIFFLAYTPLGIDHIRGVQGRYFVIGLPVTAIFVAAIVNLKLPAGVSATIATVGGMISGVVTVEGLFHAHW
jgi:uncharacterized membrane protein